MSVTGRGLTCLPLRGELYVGPFCLFGPGSVTVTGSQQRFDLKLLSHGRRSRSVNPVSYPVGRDALPGSQQEPDVGDGRGAI